MNMDFPPGHSTAGRHHTADAKQQLEAAMLRAPSDWGLRKSYFDLLDRLSAGNVGLGWALLPELGHPLFFRHGSNDIASMAQIFLADRYGAALRSTPRRILDLGAYVGYAAVYFAAKFPNATLLCAEPTADSFRILLMNTLPYRQIMCQNVGVWGHPAQLTPIAIHGGDAGLELADGAGQAGISCQGVTITALLQSAGWLQPDLIKCDIEGGEAAVFADPKIPWLNTLDALMIDCHQTASPHSYETVSACFPAEQYRHTRCGDIEVFERKMPFRAMTILAPPEIMLLYAGPGVLPILAQDVDPVPWGFFVFDGASCQLHPNSPGTGVAARVIFPRTLAGHSRALATVLHAGIQAPPVRFLMQIQTENGHILTEFSATLVEGAQQMIDLAFEPAFGPHRIILQTEVAPGFSHNRNAWARWCNPKLM
jgi:FkbM family methyltransferase